jgi:hypothetical protein
MSDPQEGVGVDAPAEAPLQVEPPPADAPAPSAPPPQVEAPAPQISVAPPPVEAPSPASVDPMVLLKQARQRQRMIFGVIAGVVLVAFLGFWFGFKSKLPAPDPRVLSDLRVDLGRFNQLPSDVRVRAAAEIISDLESRRLPASHRELFDKAKSTHTAGLFHYVVEAIEDGQLKDDWKLACPEGGPMIFENVKERKGYEQGQHLYRRCEFSRFRYLTEEEAGKAEPGHLMLAMIAYAYLDKNNAVLGEEEALFRHFTQNTAQLASESRGGYMYR